MAENLDALRQLIEERRNELQSVKVQRDKTQTEAANIEAEKVLRAELARIESEIKSETTLLETQQSVIDRMKAAVQNSSTDNPVVTGTVVSQPPAVTLPPVDPNEEDDSEVEVS